MINQPPAGARDLLPLEVVQKAWINDLLQQVFGQWGYQRVVTSTIEWLETLIAGGAIDPSTVIQLRDSSTGQLGLRPELTASIARTAVTRMADTTYPQRLCYRANVFRDPPVGHHGKQLEFYQAGVELLFSGGVLADAEILLLVADCLEQLGIPYWHLILGEASLTRSLLEPFPGSLKSQVCRCLAQLDYVTLENLDYPSVDLQQRGKLLFDLRGTPAQVLQKVSQLELDKAGEKSVNNLKYLVELIETSWSKPFPFILDLSLIQTFDYYTGIVFKAVGKSNNKLQILGQGGRYDKLLGVYHPQQTSAPGIGFSFNLEDLYTYLLTTAILPQTPPLIDFLVIAQTSRSQSIALSYAQQLRQSSEKLRVALELGGRSPEEIRNYALKSCIKTLVWMTETGEVNIETLNN
ncbi:ATP phosphoribosyltransferase regulatory subunit [cyanobacterium endosymbiont of Rhopalodia gibberula]|uniref:ATP phosphoribosyltransferase regulatory subunit n=1 Tax=cyanobacterium endosymbiont of Rhopalodia gibberula TaxID=1763363 RepID=UPI000DC70867|nr:ATP phosphoribosyltransferase regulatory subunit [cyanobacterium endosymbiont of Rhopalodia gibberula]BBA80135.1 ATP phosphoribosyltransferase regulatory subunit [cyanobacterium endosymbiont of Rhopalodia gibberula]